MYDVLIKLTVGASLLQLGISLSDFKECDSRECLARIEHASRKVTKIDWKPISIFPEEAQKFRPAKYPDQPVRSRDGSLSGARHE